jgi:hypothetical protein
VGETGTISPGNHKCRFQGKKVYLNVTAATVKAVKRIDTVFNRVENCEHKIQAGEILGWSGGIGHEKIKQTVHLELFAKETEFLKGAKVSDTQKNTFKFPKQTRFKARKPFLPPL